MKKDTDMLQRQILAAIHMLEVNDEIFISPSKVAALVWQVADPIRATPPILVAPMLDGIKQIARRLLRGTNEERERIAEGQQDDIWNGKLQSSYPCIRDGEEGYVMRQHMTEKEYEANAKRLETEGRSKIEHANALREEARRLREEGYFLRAAA